MNKSHLTALTRKKMSQPMAFLVDNDFFKARRNEILDYGCGKGFDANVMQFEKYDPFYFPQDLTGKAFKIITCNFVLNVIEDEDERAFVLLRIQHFLEEGGVAYITVRGDKKKLNGTTSKGTWQGLIELNLPVEKKTASWVMYRLTKNQSWA
jgi:2-polyprenyl-3-methyl-5-hydroxy-6-metoxy-1,4-benzoquinol methylase